MPREEGQRDAAAWGSIQRDPVTFIHFISAARNRKIDRETGDGGGEGESHSRVPTSTSTAKWRTVLWDRCERGGRTLRVAGK